MAKTLLTPEEYLEIERKAEHKSEYYQGEMSLVPSVNLRHAAIVLNLACEVSRQLKHRPCWVTMSNLRLCVSPAGFYTYPDVIVVCGKAEHADEQQDTVLNPIVLMEVLSDATSNYDRGQKFELYRMLPSLREYIIVDSNAPHLELWTRRQDDTWLLTESNDPGHSVQLNSIECVLSLAEVYHKVDWTA